MQSIEYKKFTPQRIGIAIAALGTLAIALTGTGMIFDDSDSGTDNAQPVVRSVQRPAPAYSDAFIEWNTNLPEASVERTFNAADGEPLEQIVTPPGTLQPNVLSADMIRFLEVNTMLPGTSAPSVVSYDTMLFLEQNTMLPGSDASSQPVPDETHPAGHLTEY